MITQDNKADYLQTMRQIAEDATTLQEKLFLDHYDDSFDQDKSETWHRCKQNMQRALNYMEDNNIQY